MDALWGIIDKVLTKDELVSLTLGEAFLLASSFYLHDIGMAMAGTAAGLEALVASDSYRQSCQALGVDANSATVHARALSLTIRREHADAVHDLVKQPVSGTDYYLFEPSRIRADWADTAARIAASHHWSLGRLHVEFGTGPVPLPDGEQGDLGYVACILRIADYAQINQDRAPALDRALRSSIQSDSLLHWLAQESILGPERLSDQNLLVYRSARPIQDVEAWWLFFEMMRGLDAEIKAVRRYLHERPETRARFSLEGVKAADDPERCADLVRTDGFEPIEVRVTTSTISRLVEILGGRTLYGSDPLVPVRELIQNSSDALRLKAAVAKGELERVAAGFPIRIQLREENGEAWLEVADHGVGMSKEVIQDHLLAIASDYWRSSYFFEHFKVATQSGFRPIGRFGIGFLSVFMIGDKVQIETNRSGEARYSVTLRGLGHRGEIKRLQNVDGSGTTVRVQLSTVATESFVSLATTVRNLAPMLPHTITVDTNGTSETIETGWWQELSTHDFALATREIAAALRDREGSRDMADIRKRQTFRFKLDDERMRPWGELAWPQLTTERSRLLASPYEGYVIGCSNGIAVSVIGISGLLGFYDSADLELDASRSRVVGHDWQLIAEAAKTALAPEVASTLATLGAEGFVAGLSELIHSCLKAYGNAALRESRLRWLSILRVPGEVEVIDCVEFFRRAQRAATVRLSYGVGPWSAMKHWSTPSYPRKKDDLDSVLDKAGYAYPPYRYGRDEATEIGALQELWAEYQEASTFYLVLGLVAEAWRTDIDTLIDTNAKWLRIDNSIHGEMHRD